MSRSKICNAVRPIGLQPVIPSSGSIIPPTAIITYFNVVSFTLTVRTGKACITSVIDEYSCPAPVGVFCFGFLKVAVRHLHLPSSAHDGRPTDCWHPLAGATFLGATAPEASHASNFVTSITILRCPAGRTMQSIMPLDRKPAFGNFA